MLLRGGFLCNDSTLLEDAGKWSVKGDPTEGALVVLAAKAGVVHDEIRQKNVQDRRIPFQLGQKKDDHDSQDGRWQK